MSKNELRYYMECDKIALRIPGNIKRPRLFRDRIWKYERVLRKLEYYTNVRSSRLLRIFYMLVHKRMSERLTIFIPPNVFGPGLSIAHSACIVVNSNASVGCNCRIHEGVTIGATNGSDKAAVIGDNVFLGSGCKVIGNVKIADDVAIGAGAVVVNDVVESSVSVGGVPAKVISHNGSKTNIVVATKEYMLLKQ